VYKVFIFKVERRFNYVDSDLASEFRISCQDRDLVETLLDENRLTVLTTKLSASSIVNSPTSCS
jgi:hypothetical protein